MKTFVFKYDPSTISLSDMGRRMDEALRTGIPHIQPENEIRSGSIDTLLRSASAKRIGLFMAIVNKKPDSLYELAKLVDRDQSTVLKEARSLEALGLIKFVKVPGDGKQRLKPVALYDRILIDISMASKPTKRKKVS